MDALYKSTFTLLYFNADNESTYITSAAESDIIIHYSYNVINM